MMKIEKRGQDSFTRARVELILNHPFFAALCLHLKPAVCSAGFMRNVLGAPLTAATDGRHLFYYKEWVESLPLDQQIGLLAHEALHPALGHLWRGGSRIKSIWDEAVDYAANDILTDAGFKLPEGGLYDRRFHGKSAEQNYEVLIQEAEEQPQKGKGKGKKGKGKGGKGRGRGESGDGDEDDEGQGQGQGQGEDGEDGEEDERMDGHLDKVFKPENGEDGDEEGDEEGNGDDEGGNGKGGKGGKGGKDGKGGSDGKSQSLSDILNNKGMKPEDRPENMEQEWKQKLQQAAVMAKAAGTMPGSLLSVVTERTRPRVRWQDVVERYAMDILRNDYDMQRQDRRFIETGIFFPELSGVGLKAACATDSSGSMSDKELQACTSELQGILSTKMVSELRLVICDARVQDDIILQPWDEVPGEYPGRGGTDFNPVFDLFNDEGYRPALMVYFTDGYPWGGKGDGWGEDPGYPVLWVITKKLHQKDTPDPPYGIKIERDVDEYDD